MIFNDRELDDLLEELLRIEIIKNAYFGDFSCFDEGDAVELGVKLKINENGNPRFDGYSDIRGMEYEWVNMEILKPLVKHVIERTAEKIGKMKPEIKINDYVRLPEWIDQIPTDEKDYNDGWCKVVGISQKTKRIWLEYEGEHYQYPLSFNWEVLNG